MKTIADKIKNLPVSFEEKIQASLEQKIKHVDNYGRTGSEIVFADDSKLLLCPELGNK